MRHTCNSPLRSSPGPRRSAAVAAVLIGAVCGGAPVVTLAQDQDPRSSAQTVFFDAGPIAPMKIFVGDAERWDVPVGPAATRSYGGVVSVDLDTAPRVLAATWNGKGDGQLYLASGEAQDLSRIVDRNAALVVVMKVIDPPKRKVTLRMGCGYPCGADADITGLLKAAPRDEWMRFSLDLQCFTKTGLQADKVDAAFLLLTRGRMTVSIADIRIVADTKDEATVKCS